MPIKKEKVGTLVSRLKTAKTIKYGDTSIILPPNGRSASDVIFRLIKEALPKGVVFIENK